MFEMLNNCLIVVFGVFLVSLASHAVLLPLLRRWSVYDTPNARSLHHAAVPRGGGIAIAIAFIAGVSAVAPSQTLGADVLELCSFSIAFAALGAWDDWGPRSAALRLILQFVLASAFMGVYMGESGWAWPPVALVLGAVAAVWMVNLFNFMDGADGFAGTQAILFALGMAGSAAFVRSGSTASIALVLAAAVSGFLPYNWHPARLFMGDSGSYFSGFCIVTVAALWFQDTRSLVVPLILVAPFVTDATWTLARRIVRGERFWTAHRSHVYQRAILNGVAVRRVITVLVAVNIVLCWTATGLVLASRVSPLIALAVTYGLLGAFWYHAELRYPTVDTASR